MPNGDDSEIAYFASTNFRGTGRRFGIKQSDRLTHLYLIGKTGVGKSSLVETMAMQDFGARSKPAVHESGERGRQVLVEEGGIEGGERTFLVSSAHRQFLHSLMVCECLASIELATLERPNLRFIPWAEMLARAPESTRAAAVPFRIPVSSGAVMPDGLFGLEYQREDKKAYRFFALEADRGTMPVVRSAGKQTSYLAKLAAYQEIIDQQLHKKHWGISSLFVLTVTTSEQRLAEIASRFGECPDSTPLFLFKAVENSPRALCTPLPRLLTEPWPRAGMPALSIAESD